MTTVVNFVCDRLPDQDGCRFIELENDKGESVGADVGEWRSREDGLVELRVALSQQSKIDSLEATIAEQAKMIERLRGGPTPLYTAVDMANAARDGFRDGAASRDAEIQELKEEISLDDNLIAERDRLLNLFDCPDHGPCVPYAMEQIAALRKDADKWKIVQRCMDLLQADERNASIWSVCSRLLISTAHKMNSAISTVLEEGVTIGEEEVGDWRVTVERVNMSKEG